MTDPLLEGTLVENPVHRDSVPCALKGDALYPNEAYRQRVREFLGKDPDYIEADKRTHNAALKVWRKNVYGCYNGVCVLVKISSKKLYHRGLLFAEKIFPKWAEKKRIALYVAQIKRDTKPNAPCPHTIEDDDFRHVGNWF